MTDIVPSVQRLVESYLQVIVIAVIPPVLMLFDAWLKSWLGMKWEACGADIALCGVATLTSSVFAAHWNQSNQLVAAIIILGAHGIFWTAVLKCASCGWRIVQALAGAAVFYSAALFALYYSRQVG